MGGDCKNLHPSEVVKGPNTICLFDQNMGQFLNPNNLIVNTKMNETIVVFLHTMQMNQTWKLIKVKPKGIFDIGCDHFGPNVAIVFFVHALHLWWGLIVIRQGGILNKMLLLNVVSKKETS